MQIRQMDVILSDLAQELGLAHTTYSSNWIHVLKKNDKQLIISGYKFSLNDAAASRTASDKVATYEVLSSAGIAAAPHVLVRKSKVNEISWYGECNAPYIMKPLAGTSGNGVVQIVDKVAVERHIVESDLNAWAVSPYIDVKREVRLVMLDGKLLLVYEKQPVIVDGLKMFNLGLGAKVVDIEVSKDMVRLAENTMRAINLRVAAIDIIETQDEWMVLEVNDGFGMEKYIKQGDLYKKRATDMYARIIQSIFNQ